MPFSEPVKELVEYQRWHEVYQDNHGVISNDLGDELELPAYLIMLGNQQFELDQNCYTSGTVTPGFAQTRPRRCGRRASTRLLFSAAAWT